MIYTVMISRDIGLIYFYMPLTKKLFKSLFSGGFVALIYLVLTYTLTEFLEINYLISTIIAFIVSFFLTFSLQKFWTFKNYDSHQLSRQLLFFTMQVICNVLISTPAIYLLVELLNMWYIHAQIFVLGTLAVINFIIFSFIFKNKITPSK